MSFNKSVCFFIFLLIFFSSNTFAGFYGDLEIDVLSDGRVTVSGITNYEELKNISGSQEYTSKRGEMWLFNLSTNVVFEDFIFKLNLPPNVEINYIKTTPNFRIEHGEESLTLIGLGEDQVLNIMVQYKIKKSLDEGFFSKDVVIAFLSGLLVLSLVVLTVIWLRYFYFTRHVSKTEKVKKGVDEAKDEGLEIDLELLSDRQREIVLILKEKKKVSQKELAEIMDIPKSSISRNVNSLVAKRIVDKQRVGVTTYVFFKK